MPVFLSRKVSSPRRRAHRAVVQSTAGFRCIRTVFGDQFVVTTHRTTDIHFGITRNPAIKRTPENNIPLAVVVAFDMNHRHTVRGDFLAHFIGRTHTVDVGSPVGMQSALIDVLMVHHQQTFAGAVTTGFQINREKVHAVMMHAHLLLLLFSGIGAIRLVGWIRPGNWRAPGKKRFGGVSLGNNDLIRGRSRDSLETQFSAGCVSTGSTAIVVTITVTATTGKP